MEGTPFVQQLYVIYTEIISYRDFSVTFPS